MYIAYSYMMQYYKVIIHFKNIFLSPAPLLLMYSGVDRRLGYMFYPIYRPIDKTFR